MKDTVIPGSVGLALLGYVGLAGLTSTPLTMTGDAGDFIDYYLAGAGCWLEDAGNLDSTGKLTVRSTSPAVRTASIRSSRRSTDQAGNISTIVVSTPTMTLDTVVPTGSFTVNGAPSNTALTNNPTVSLAISFTDAGSGRISCGSPSTEARPGRPGSRTPPG